MFGKSPLHSRLSLFVERRLLREIILAVQLFDAFRNHLSLCVLPRTLANALTRIRRPSRFG